MATANTRRSRHCMDIAAMIVGVAVGLVASAGMHGVRADNFGGPKDGPPAVCNTTNMLYSQCVGENWLHEVNYSSTLVPIWRTAFNSTGATYDAGSSVLLFMDDAYAPDNDARAANTNIQNGYWGWTRCASGATTGTRLPGSPLGPRAELVQAPAYLHQPLLRGHLQHGRQSVGTGLP